MALWMCIGSAARAQSLVISPAADRCVDESSVRAQLDRWAEGRAIDVTLAVEVHVEATRAWFEVRRAQDIVAERHFDTWPESCEERTQTLALAIAIALEHASEQPTVLDATAATESAPAAVPGPPPDATSGLQVERADRVRLHAVGAWSGWVLPSPSWWLGAGTELPVSDAWRLHLTVLGAPSSTFVVGGARARMHVLGARALGCVPLLSSALAVEGCGGALAALVWARGLDYADNNAVTLGAVATVGRLALRWPSDARVSLRATLDLSLQWVRPRVQAEGTSLSARAAGWVGVMPNVEVIVTL